MSESPRRRWRINPQTLGLEPGDGDRPTKFTAQEIREQEWPPCPTCGTTIDVSVVETKDLGSRLPTYIPGRWTCPNNCKRRAPRRA